MHIESHEGRMVLERRAGVLIAVVSGAFYGLRVAGMLTSRRASWFEPHSWVFLVVLGFLGVPVLVALVMPFASDAVQRIELTRTPEGVQFRFLMGSIRGPLRVTEEILLAPDLEVSGRSLSVGGRRIPHANADGPTEQALRRLIEGPSAPEEVAVGPRSF